ncbi:MULTISPECIES: hypothetical protein [unclassified Legionella]|uniref:hypothetical protein n=1 Tax=unclassified Legionella TaxID=2622702 RepID=UPI0010561F40|nr:MULTISPECIES: hypothetical protein [unclassified Legionella]MDI9818874.1 hypothetical protein [Legionella sp. PL877]
MNPMGKNQGYEQLHYWPGATEITPVFCNSMLDGTRFKSKTTNYFDVQFPHFFMIMRQIDNLNAGLLTKEILPLLNEFRFLQDQDYSDNSHEAFKELDLLAGKLATQVYVH